MRVGCLGALTQFYNYSNATINDTFGVWENYRVINTSLCMRQHISGLTSCKLDNNDLNSEDGSAESVNC